MAETEKNELAAIDFVFDPNTMYGFIGHHVDVRNYFRSHRNRKYLNLTLADVRKGSRRVSCDQRPMIAHFRRKSTSDSHFRSNRKWKNMAETGKMNSQPSTSYSTQYNVWVYRPPFRRQKLLPVLSKPEVLKSDVGRPQKLL